MSRLGALALVLVLSAGNLPAPSAAPALAPKVPVELLQARRDAAEEFLRITRGLDKARFAQADPDELVQWSRRLLEAEKALGPGKKALIAACRKHWVMTRRAEDIAAAKVAVAGATRAKIAAARYYRLEAEIWLTEAGGKVPEVEQRLDWDDFLDRWLDEHRSDDFLDRWLDQRRPKVKEWEPLRMPRPDDVRR